MKSIVSQPMPHWQGSAVVNGEIVSDFNLSRYLGQYLLLFFYPLDFTFVCPTELHAFQQQLEEFSKRGAAVVGCSVDSCHAHLAWLRTAQRDGGIEGVTYPLIGDLNKELASLLGVLGPTGVAFRASFLIDKQGIIHRQLVHNLPLGRAVEEELRALDALQAYERNGQVCPANWRAGSKQMEASQRGVQEYFTKN